MNSSLSQTTRRELKDSSGLRNRLMASLAVQIRRLERLTPPQALQQEHAAELAALLAAQETLRERQQQAEVEAQRRAEREVWR